MEDSFGRRGYDLPHDLVEMKVIETRLDNLIKCQENTVGEVKEFRKELGEIRKDIQMEIGTIKSQIGTIYMQQARLPVMVEGAKLLFYAILILLLLLMLLTENVSLKEFILKLL